MGLKMKVKLGRTGLDLDQRNGWNRADDEEIVRDSLCDI